MIRIYRICGECLEYMEVMENGIYGNITFTPDAIIEAACTNFVDENGTTVTGSVSDVRDFTVCRHVKRRRETPLPERETYEDGRIHHRNQKALRRRRRAILPLLRTNDPAEAFATVLTANTRQNQISYCIPEKEAACKPFQPPPRGT